MAETIAAKSIGKSSGKVRIRTFLMSLIVVLLFFLPHMLRFSGRNVPAMRDNWLVLIIPAGCLIVFYINYLCLIPRLLEISKGRSAKSFVVGNLILFMVYTSGSVGLTMRMAAQRQLHHTAEAAPPPGHRMEPPYINDFDVQFVLRDLVYFIMSILLAYALRSYEQRVLLERRRLEYETNAKDFELKYLRSQLNPHFLFNTLNNIYALTAISPDRAQKAIHELSAMLRYLIYDTGGEMIPLRREVDALQEFISLSRLRLASSFRLTTDIMLPTGDEVKVPPLVILTIAENAFKHCNKTSPEAFIDIKLQVFGSRIRMQAANSYEPRREDPPSGREKMQQYTHGIGIANIREQLRLIYGSHACLEIRESDNVYSVELDINPED